ELICFFFSSRRRHTRSKRDWSSDVCSSDLNKYKSDIQSAIDETAKYPVKDTDFMTDDEEKNLKRLSDLEEGLHRKRLISYGGLLKEIHKKLNLDDTEEGDLI